MIAAAILMAFIGQGQEEYIAQEEKKVQRARRILEANPTDPEAALQVGKFLCFVKASWDEGLPVLAVCKDQALVTLAMTDLGTRQIDQTKGSPLTGATVDFGEETAIELVKGDQWWTEAGKHQGALEKINIYNRAGYWYRRAVKTVDEVRRKRLYARINAHTRAMGAIEIKVPTSTLSTDTGIEVVEGQLVKVTAKGTWAYGADKEKVDWKGYHNSVAGQPLPRDINFFCLTAKVGESGKKYPCYKENPHVSETSGHLILGPNHWASEGVGELTVSIELTLPY
jgi:hypothetical protein